MRDIVIVGTQGCAKEILFLLEENNKIEPEWNILGFVDYVSDSGNARYPVLGDDVWLVNQTRELNVVIAVGSPELRYKLYKKYSVSPYLNFPSLISKHALVGENKIGKGCVICNNCTVTVDVELGDFVIVNIGATICHESRIGNFTTIAPGVNISGNVSIGELCDVGVGTKIIQNVSVGDNVIVGAGTIVIRNVGSNCTIVGNPARVVKCKD